MTLRSLNFIREICERPVYELLDQGLHDRIVHTDHTQDVLVFEILEVSERRVFGGRASALIIVDSVLDCLARTTFKEARVAVLIRTKGVQHHARLSFLSMYAGKMIDLVDTADNM